MTARRYAAILLLVYATGYAAPPNRPDPVAGRAAFQHHLKQAQVAWSNGKRAEALRCYHSAKMAAVAHRLTLDSRDEQLLDFLARHEAGVSPPEAAGPKPLSHKDAGGRTSPHPVAKRKIPLAADAEIAAPRQDPARPTRPATTKTTPAALSRPGSRTIPPATKRSIRPANSAPTQALPIKTTPPADSFPKPPVPSLQTPTVVKPATPSSSETPRHAPAGAPARPAESQTTSRPSAAPQENDLVPPVTPPTAVEPTQAPSPSDPGTATDGLDDSTSEPLEPAPPLLTPEDNDLRGATTIPPVRLVADSQAARMDPPVQPPPAPAPTPTPVDDAAADAAPSLGITDHQFLSMMFVPIIVALALLGLLTQELPKPSTILARLRRKPAADPLSDEASTPASMDEVIATSAMALPVQIEPCQHKNTRCYTVTIELPGLEPTRLVKRGDGTPLFRSRAAALNSARHAARRLGYDTIEEATGSRVAA